jgi:riboflavin kinase/FMN adenylyltransferase
MKIIYGIKGLGRLSSPTAVTVGVFDGVHIGHQKIIKELIKESSASGAKSVVVTFYPHPDKVLKGKDAPAMLTSLKHRLHLLASSGVELCLVINFNKRFALMDTLTFSKEILKKRLNIKMLVVGEDFSFGSDRLNTGFALNNIAKRLNFKLAIVKSERFHSKNISSSIIRHLIEKGKLDTAQRLLGRPVSVLGTVVKGRRRGRVIGFKTANINPHHEAIPPSGVYAVYTKVEDKTYKSVLNIGTRPTFGEKEPTIEVHIFGIDRNLYGKDIEIYFKRRLRPEKRFQNKDHLVAQIIKDAEKAKRLL